MNKKVILLIICNEFCERYCFYGYRSILFAFLRSEFLFSKRKATFIVHLFVSLCYLFTLAGGFVSDFALGKYKTILYLSIVYFTGTALVTYSSIKIGSAMLLYLGLLMIALGTGGIKPCVAAFGGDQIENDSQRENNLSRFFNFFYFAINLGSMLSSFISPLLSSLGCGSRFSCYPVAFGSSSILLATSIILFYVGSSCYVKHKPKAGNIFKEISNIFNMMFNLKKTKPDGILEEHHMNQTSEHYNILRILKLFVPITFFWMLFDQQTTTWVEQGFKMKDTSIIGNTNVKILSSQMQTFNSIFIILFIPIFTKLIYPFFEYIGLKLTPIKKMGCGIFLAAFSFMISAYLEHKINEYSLINQKISILWQLPQYLSLTAGEIMLNMTGLEFAYSEAPDSMKTLLLSCWLLTVTFGNFFVILYSSFDIIKFLNTSEADKYNFIMYALMGLGASYIMFTLEKGYNKKK